MSRLTQSQLSHMIDAQSALESREIVVLKGKNDGKTRVAYELQEAIATKMPDGKIRTERRHEENSQVEFVNRIAWPRSDKVCELAIMRQIVAINLEDGEKMPFQSHRIVDRFHHLLLNFRKENRILCIAIDNAELLPRNAFSVIKALNEIRDTKGRRAIGCAALVAGQYAKLKAPVSFFKHATEVRIGRITQAEIGELIENHYPAEAMRFNDNALGRLAQLESTLDIHSAVRKAIMIRKQKRGSGVDGHLIDQALAA